MNRLSILCIVLAFSLAFSTDALAQEGIGREGKESSETDLSELREVSYLEMGANLGLPAVLNGLVGYWFGPVGLRVSGMYWGDERTEGGRNGIQCDIGYKLSDNVNTLHSLAVIGGTSRESCCDWSYLGGAYCLNHKWFFLELGLVKVVEHRRGRLPSFHGVLQIGYMRRFLPERK